MPIPPKDKGHFYYDPYPSRLRLPFAKRMVGRQKELNQLVDKIKEIRGSGQNTMSIVGVGGIGYASRLGFMLAASRMLTRRYAMTARPSSLWSMATLVERRSTYSSKPIAWSLSNHPTAD